LIELKRRRLELGYSQEALAARSGMSFTTICAIELQKRPPQDFTLVKLAKALGVRQRHRWRLMETVTEAQAAGAEAVS